jgi:hypothetical protein
LGISRPLNGAGPANAPNGLGAGAGKERFFAVVPIKAEGTRDAGEASGSNMRGIWTNSSVRE